MQATTISDVSSSSNLEVVEGLTALLSLILLLGIAVVMWLILGFFSKLSEMDREFKTLTIGSDRIGSDWGKVRLDQFAIRCSAHVALAKWYLNSKARQLNALKEVDEFRDVMYLFGEAKRNFVRENLALLSQSNNVPIRSSLP